MQYLRWLLFPFSLLFGLVIIIRNWLFDAGLFKSHEFDIPVISVGNLEVGGAGKSPMTEYLIRLFKDQYKLATLSRGYGRKTKGYLLATTTTTAKDIGDEPAQFNQKFKDITVAVCENRVLGIEHLSPNHQLIILDDAYQHRPVKPGFSILLFDYHHINDPRLLLPAGNFREPFSGRWRAELLVISKCPVDLSESQQAEAAERIGPLPYQKLFFTSIAYQPMKDLDGNSALIKIDEHTAIFLITAIADAKPLMQHLEHKTTQIVHHNYPDHHPFTLKNIAKLADEFSGCKAEKKIIITTEKDAQRLGEQAFQSLLRKLPVFVLPIAIRFLGDGKKQFDQILTNYVREHTANHQLH
jgi:tetraacyldisaccharide 4'-kinase